MLTYVVLTASRREQEETCSWCDNKVTHVISCRMNSENWREYACEEHQQEHFPQYVHDEWIPTLAGGVY